MVKKVIKKYKCIDCGIEISEIDYHMNLGLCNKCLQKEISK